MCCSSLVVSAAKIYFVMPILLVWSAMFLRVAALYF